MDVNLTMVELYVMSEFLHVLFKKKKFIEKKIEPMPSSKDLNLENLQKIVKEMIQEAEKKIDLHIKNLNIMYNCMMNNTIIIINI